MKELNLIIAFAVCMSIVSGTSLVRLTDPYLHLECPHWDPVLGVLYMVDHARGFVIKYDPNSIYHTSQVYLGSGEVGPILTVEGSNNTFVAGRGRDVIKFQWDGLGGAAENITVLASVEPQNLANAFNCGKVDSKGRIWIGTYATDGKENQGGLYMIDPANDFKVVKKLNVSKSNGMDWTQDDKQFYYIDSPTCNIDLFDYESETGGISNRKAFYNTINSTYFGVESIPGGMALDNETNIWIASSTETAGYVGNINSTNGDLFRFANLNPKLITSLVWGGENLDELYVTTSRLGLTQNEIDFWYGSGALFGFFDMGPSGYASNKVRLSLT